MTLLSFFIIDPEFTGEPGDSFDCEIPATNRVPPQQQSWIKQALEESLNVRVPMEVIDRILDHAEWLTSDEEARQLAQQMKEERVHFWKQHNRFWFSLPFIG